MAKKINIGSLIASKTKETFSNNQLISSESVKNNIQIIEELRLLIPPLGVEEFTQLENNIIKNGCRDALTVWETTTGVLNPDSEDPATPCYILVDGHNRYEICKKNGISFSVQLMSFASLQQVKEYMIDLQLGRRNLTPEQISYFRGLRFLNEKNEIGRYERQNHAVQNEPYDFAEKGDTAERLSKEFNVGRSTIKRDAAFAKGLNKLDTEFRNEILTGKKKVAKGVIQALANETSLTEPIVSLEQLESVATKTSVEQKTQPTSEFDTHYQLLLKIANDFYINKSKKHLTELQDIISKLEGFIS
ncbi:hypothetical protein [Flectobacillus longus]|uniref:hypothetical protein n=1 Tax=Flectobacillus longus TaxID=2984207 RepID=UPI0024B67C2A|nr:hypothetical protein [Flectobacillus longus]MDI9881075.1 hypothetical protein [Flectobacillus longus]